ncbi:DnaJ C-terminal domain-containing protein [Shinella kummerowiae]|jgi:DnaJ-class molecular chaperone|uniref:DnaJ C-terminal domain-containing protein n=1 Tax=Shinella kummerowiae TaxID=417745 RepID=UPI0021B5F40C|nr:DnaJ C-terminal domain-containing protein [Shinella kummerowiae]MCT7663001.1 DnaJ domain-containing protein [Shinella kummerowiae]
MRDPYSVLGVKRNAGQDEIKAAWRSVAKAVHPDQNHDDPNATVRFTEAGRAYDLLRDPDKRSRYDRHQREAELRRMEQMRRQQAERKAQTEAPQRVVDEGAEDMIARIFGVDSRGQPAEAKPDARPQPQAQQPNAATAPDTRKTTGETAPDETASARAAAPAAAIISAIIRRIRGSRAKVEKAPDLVADVTVTVEDILNRVRPTLETPDGQTLRVPIGAGSTDGQVIRLREAGHRLENLKRGDAIVTVRVAPGRFRVDGFDLKVDLPITIENAVLGCETTIEGPLGPLPVSVPAWSGSDQTITIAGEGLVKENGERGDLIAEIRLLLWEKPDAKMIDLMRSLREGLYL